MSPVHAETELETAALAWLASKSAASFSGAADPLPWLDHLTRLFFAAVHHPIPPQFSEGSWAVRIEGRRLTLQSGLGSVDGSRLLLVPHRECEVRYSGLWRWLRQGVRRAWFFESADGWKEWDLRALLTWRSVRRLAVLRGFPLPRWLGCGRQSVQFALARLGMNLCGGFGTPWRFHQAREIDAQWQSMSTAFVPPPAPSETVLRDIVHYTGALFSGGAERQLCNVAVSQARRGLRVRVHTAYSLVGERAHYAPVLQRDGVALSSPLDTEGRGLARLPWSLARLLPVDLADKVAALTAALADDPPQLLHCWLDEPNVIGALAGLLVGVPHIILSTRNSNPCNFPRLHTPYLLPLYRLVAQQPSVQLIANSHSGAASYAEWIGIPLNRFHVVFNGVRFDHFPRPTPEARRQARAALGVKPDAPVVAGVFRLAAEKQPHLFLDVVHRVRQQVPTLQVLLVGDGDQAAAVDQQIHALGLRGCVHRLGRRRDVDTIYLAADVTLLTSLLEGCPNVVLESQHLGVPVVATAGGGTTDAILHGTTGYLSGVSDAESLARHLSALLRDPSLRARMGQAGPSFVASRFGLDHMIDQTQAVYTAAGRVLPPALAA